MKNPFFIVKRADAMDHQNKSSKSPGLCSLNIIKSPIQFVYAVFFSFCFKCRKHNYFCCDFLIINLSFVANFEVECF